MSSEIAVQENASVAPWTPSFAVGVDEAVAAVNAKRDFFKRVMRPDEHYGKIPGTGDKAKPTLLKPGAELLLANMGLQKELADADEPTIDYGDVAREGLIRYRRVCRIYRQTGPTEAERMLVAQAEGSCSSRETKYRWRQSGASCPDCGKPLRMSKDKPEWYCWKKKGGCGATFPKAQFTYEQVPNPDLADVENTILKMADKRALVAATLLATGCSDLFTQDVDDNIRDDEGRRIDTIDGEFTEHYEPTLQETHDEIYGLLCSLALPQERAQAAVEWASTGRTTDYQQLDEAESRGLLGKLRSLKAQSAP